MKRVSVNVPGLEHGDNPTPAASRCGPLLATGAVAGWALEGKALPSSLAEEVDNAFANLAAVLVEGGGSLEAVVHVNVFAGVDDLRPALNAAWERCFPDPGSRPARHLLRTDLPAGLRIQLEAMAYVGDGAA